MSTCRFRMVAGPNGSGKTTLVATLRRDYAVNFYTMLNADDIFAETSRSLAYHAPFPVEAWNLREFAQSSGYAKDVKAPYFDGRIEIVDDMVLFASPECVTSYTIAMLVGFLQREFLSRLMSFSQETVFSHVSKVGALAEAKRLGYRTYLYFVSTQDVSINVSRVSSRVANGGHSVPEEKIKSREERCYVNVKAALPYLSRAFFFDNSGGDMCLVAEYSEETGFVPTSAMLPKWLSRIC